MIDTGRVPHARILLAAAVIVVVAAALFIRLRPPSARQLLFEMRPTLDLMRDSAEACRDALEREQSAFVALGDRVDTLRARATALEALHPDGVPADSYRVYLDVVDSFNAAVQGWEPAASSVAARRAACSEVVERQNGWTDSARALTRRIEAQERAP